LITYGDDDDELEQQVSLTNQGLFFSLLIINLHFFMMIISASLLLNCNIALTNLFNSDDIITIFDVNCL